MSINSCQRVRLEYHLYKTPPNGKNRGRMFNHPQPPKVAMSSRRRRVRMPDSEHTLSLFLPLSVFVIHSPSPRWGWRRTSLPLPHCLNTPQRHGPRHPRSHKASSIPPSPSSPEPVELQLFRKLFNL